MIWFKQKFCKHYYRYITHIAYPKYTKYMYGSNKDFEMFTVGNTDVYCKCIKCGMSKKIELVGNNFTLDQLELLANQE